MSKIMTWAGPRAVSGMLDRSEASVWKQYANKVPLLKNRSINKLNLRRSNLPFRVDSLHGSGGEVRKNQYEGLGKVPETEF